MKLFSRHIPFWFISFSTLIGLTLPNLIQDGMFLDAQLYAGVSHNLSMGIGSYWFPQFSPTYRVAESSAFLEHPPLVFWIQSVFFKMLGDSMYVERFYTFLMMCITAFLINLLWKNIFKNEENLKRLSWLPIILWITIPVCFWSYSNNMQENTMGVFTLTSVIFTFRYIQFPKHNIPALILSGIFIFLATMSKGLPGFFPIAVPFLFWLTTKKISFLRAVFSTAILIIIPFVIYTLLFNMDASRESLSFYLFKRVFVRIEHDPTVENRFYILYRIFTELLPQLLLVTIFFSIAIFKKNKIQLFNRLDCSVFFIAVGLSASAPLMLTLVQKGFYFVPSLPFFAIGLSVFIAPIVSYFVNQINTENKNFKIFFIASAFLFIGTIGFSMIQKGKVRRDKEMLHDVYLIGSVVPKYTTIGVPTEVWKDYVLECYLIRYFNISIHISDQHDFYMVKKTMDADTFSNYKRIDIDTKMYNLYVKQ